MNNTASVAVLSRSFSAHEKLAAELNRGLLREMEVRGLSDFASLRENLQTSGDSV